ncbi:hypothetical protein [Spartinivicinus poritis]|uniref:Secreted protein n=1 Tax=Spartinivicinus poritis TaxID=2994640 RepID=A0ABT5UAN4_9GAMM|nr:hypothetical protein [Spartinivicinus sp. A2-2]MDE1463434.1 hypothetical protein [Spartinivicinus sp. A2-2]
MKKKLAAALTALTVVGTGSGYAETTNVFCATSDGSYWEWLVVEGVQVEINGQWGRGTQANGAYFDYFSVSEGSYLLLNQVCKLTFGDDYIAQPADNSADDWFIFLVNKTDGRQYLSDGRYNVTQRNLPTSAFRL